MRNEIIKNYNDYVCMKKDIICEKWDTIHHDHMCQYNHGDHSIDITLREYDGVLSVDYDVFNIKINDYIDSGSICAALNLPDKESVFLDMIKNILK